MAGGALSPFFFNLTEKSLTFALENLIKYIYHRVVPNTWNFIGIILLSLILHFNESFLLFGTKELLEFCLEIKTCLCHILDIYIGFIFILDLSYRLINHEKLKKNNPIFYNIILVISNLILFSLILLFFYYLNKLLLIILEKVLEIIKDCITKMMANPRGGEGGSSQPGGFGGEPAGGGGGQPPKKPAGPQPPQPAPSDHEDNYPFNYEYGSEDEYPLIEEDPSREYDKEVIKKRNRECARFAYTKMDPIKKEILLAKKRKYYATVQGDEEKRKNKEARIKAWKEKRSLEEKPEKRRFRLEKKQVSNQIYESKLGEDQKKLRLERRSEQYKLKKANETPEEKRARLDRNNELRKLRIESETPEAKRARLDKRKEAAKKRKEQKKDDQYNN